MEQFIPATQHIEVDFDPFAGPAIKRTVPTTEAQMEVLAAAKMGDEANCAYVESVSLILKGDLDRGAMEKALQDLVDRHESLRSVISANGMRMLVFEQAELAIPFHDLSDLNENIRAIRLEELAESDMTQPFDLLHGPLFRVQLIRTGKEEHILRMSGHHAVLDGWSLGILMAETSVLYTVHHSGIPSDLPPAVPFSTYVMATLDHAKTAEHAVVEKFWTDLFKGPIPRLDLPTDRVRPARKTFNGERLDLVLDPELVKGLRTVATRNGASFVTALLTVFEVLLHKLTGSSDIVAGLPAAGQSDLDMKHLVGHCVNLLALRSHVDDDMAFDAHLKERRTEVLDAFDHQKYTFGTLVQKLKVPREPGRIPLVPVVFNIDMDIDDGVVFDGLDHTFVSNPRHYENFELFLNATSQGEGLVLEWSYNTDLFDASTIRDWMDRFISLIARINKNASLPIGRLIDEEDLMAEGTLPPAEWHGSRSDIPRDRGMDTLFDEVVNAHRDRTALVAEDGEWSYGQLHARVLSLTGALQTVGVGSGDLVGLCTDRCPDMVAAMLAILRCGAAFVPFDPSYPAERLAFMFRDTDVNVLLTQRHLSAALPPHKAKVLLLEESVDAAPSTQLPLGGPASPAYIMYTSGSTGEPKGVVVPHRAVIRLVRDQNYLPFGPGLTFLQLSNISFDASTLEIWGPLLNGGKLVLQPQLKPTLAEIVNTIKQHDVTTAWFTAGLFNLLVDEQLDDLRALKHILVGGDVLSVPHVKRALHVLGPDILINGYGPTENTTFTCCHAIHDEHDLKVRVPIGRPIANTTVYILDARMHPVGIGAKGELYTGGDGVALGYWRKPELTAEQFVDDPFSKVEGAKLYRTGDFVRWLPDGAIDFLGRGDGQVKVRGYRVEVGEIENALNDHPQVKDRVVVVRNDGPGEKQLVFYVVPKQEHVAEDPEARGALIADIREHLRGNLPDHMIPTAFVVLPAFPLNRNGKVDRQALPAPSMSHHPIPARHVAPRNAEEHALATIWSTVLGADNISVLDNFFELGGHSMTGLRLLAQVEEQFGRALPLNALFQAPTIDQFAKLITTEKPAVEWTNLVAIQSEGDRIPFFCVHGDEANYFIPRHLGKGQPFYAYFHQGEDGLPIRYTKVEDIASHFIKELLSVRPEGPYLLGGYSFGGIVAYEMACQLRSKGQDVPLLALFDTYSPHAYIEVMRAEQKLHDPLKQMIMRRMVRREQGQGRINSLKLRHFHIIDTYDKAIRAYAPPPYAGPLTMYKAVSSSGPEDMGWSKHVTGDLDIHVLPGDHSSMIKEPFVEELATRLALDIAQAVHGTITEQR